MFIGLKCSINRSPAIEFIDELSRWKICVGKKRGRATAAVELETLGTLVKPRRKRPPFHSVMMIEGCKFSPRSLLVGGQQCAHIVRRTCSCLYLLPKVHVFQFIQKKVVSPTNYVAYSLQLWVIRITFLRAVIFVLNDVQFLKDIPLIVNF